eukprot:CAMPEP_0198723958 /NCGR_PEP_ID=MMETSP1475-20131203/1464_1 /TAXON_ID= ORGANISM="Unidentified sp., Strain CCMP1999" /NCGR_SAMPLE_ID=MMETSP1475 /ASSEMBLY_ACC=CAM_ASM_001111 /LENGTH=231 /DNA_ID=CAMNT_0044485305 /DNA_START=196 /DNA_END=891 /DNA_ORIENTATION=+
MYLDKQAEDVITANATESKASKDTRRQDISAAMQRAVKDRENLRNEYNVIKRRLDFAQLDSTRLRREAERAQGELERVAKLVEEQRDKQETREQRSLRIECEDLARKLEAIEEEKSALRNKLQSAASQMSTLKTEEDLLNSEVEDIKLMSRALLQAQREELLKRLDDEGKTLEGVIERLKTDREISREALGGSVESLEDVEDDFEERLNLLEKRILEAKEEAVKLRQELTK